MRVRQWAVVGAALVAAWAGGSGVASATGDETPPACQAVYATVEGEGPPATEECPTPPPTTDPAADDQVDVGITGDCALPEVFSFEVKATNLDAATKYTILFVADNPATFVSSSGDGFPGFHFDFTTDANGAYTGTFTGTQGGEPAPNTGFTVAYAVLGNFDLQQFLDELANAGAEGVDPVLVSGGETVEPVLVDAGEIEVGACVPPTATPTTSAPAPAAPTTHPSTAPATTTTVVPVAVSPAAAHPAVLANTGSPVASAALLGGGLLVAGAGALVATRRRAS